MRASWKPEPSVIVTRVGMISSIFGITRLENSMRAGIDIAADDRAKDEAEEQVDAGPQPAADDVEEVERPRAVAGDRDDQADHDDGDDRQPPDRHDLHGRT